MVPGRPLVVRADFARLCDDLGLREAVEVGTDCGLFAMQLLAASPHLVLYTVDPWLPYAEIKHDRTGAREAFSRNVLPYMGRVFPLQMSSLEASQVIRMSRRTVDFVYIDGAHDRENVAQNLVCWYDVLRPGGLLAGHDWDLAPVSTAVVKFVCHHRLSLFVLSEYGNENRRDHDNNWAHPSWYFFKPDERGHSCPGRSSES